MAAATLTAAIARARGSGCRLNGPAARAAHTYTPGPPGIATGITPDTASRSITA